MSNYFLPVPSKVGTWCVEGNVNGVVTIHLPNAPQTPSSGKVPAPVAACAKQMREYFSSKRQDFDVQLSNEGATQFQQQVWNALSKIPYGEVRTYAEVAKAVRRPKAARAVGNANHANPFPLVVPCHRVVASNGLGGYGGGEDVKRYLLQLEGIALS